MIAPDVNPWGPLFAGLTAIGAVTMMHLLHHAIHYPFKRALSEAWQKYQERRVKPEYLPEGWRPRDRGAQARMLLALRDRTRS